MFTSVLHATRRVFSEDAKNVLSRKLVYHARPTRPVGSRRWRCSTRRFIRRLRKEADAVEGRLVQEELPEEGASSAATATVASVIRQRLTATTTPWLPGTMHRTASRHVQRCVARSAAIGRPSTPVILHARVADVTARQQSGTLLMQRLRRHQEQFTTPAKRRIARNLPADSAFKPAPIRRKCPPMVQHHQLPLPRRYISPVRLLRSPYKLRRQPSTTEIEP